MARTKNGIRRMPEGPPAKTPRALPVKRSHPRFLGPIYFGRARERVWKSGVAFPPPRAPSYPPFGRLVRDIEQDYMAAPSFQAQAIEALQYAAESHLVKLLEDVNLLAHHAKRITVHKFGLKLVRRIRGELE